MRTNFKENITTLGVFFWSLGTLFYAFEFLVRTSTNAISQDLIHSLNLSAAAVGIIGSAFYWFYIAAQIPAGIAVDKYGARKTLVFSTFVAAIGTLLFGLSHSFWVLCVARAFMGFGGGFAFVCSLKLASSWIPDRFFPLFAGFSQFMGYMGAAISGTPLVLVLHHYHWNVVFIALTVLCLVLFFVTLCTVRVKGMSRIPTSIPSTPVKENVRMLGKISRNFQVIINGLYCTFMMGATSAFSALWGIDYLTHVKHTSVTDAATASSLVFIGVAVCSPLWGLIASIFRSNKLPLVIAALLAFVTTFSLLYLPISTAFIFIACFLFGGFQSAHVLNFTMLNKLVEQRHLGTAIAFLNMFTVAGGAILQPISGILIGIESHKHAMQHYTAHDFMIGLSIIPIVQVLAFILSLMFKEKRG